MVDSVPAYLPARLQRTPAEALHRMLLSRMLLFAAKQIPCAAADVSTPGITHASRPARIHVPILPLPFPIPALDAVAAVPADHLPVCGSMLGSLHPARRRAGCNNQPGKSASGGDKGHATPPL